MGEKIKVLIVDDSTFMRNILTRLISMDARFEVIGQANNGAEGVEMVAALKPDVVTMDIEMPVMNGIEALTKIMEDTPTPVIMVSTLTEEGAEATLECLEKGAVDFIPKSLENKDSNIINASKLLHDKLSLAAIVKARIADTIEKPSFNANIVDSKPLPNTEKQNISSVVGDIERFSKAKLLLIGCSTGGPNALHQIIPNLPADLRVPVVIAQHMPENFTGPMATRLNNVSNIEVVEGVDGQVLKNGLVYIAPGGINTKIVSDGGELKLSIKKDESDNENNYFYPSVNVLASSAKNAVGGDVVGVMLTGMGNDGQDGFTELFNSGAYIVAQDEASCVVYGMPRALVDNNIVKSVVRLNEISSTIIKLLA